MLEMREYTRYSGEQQRGNAYTLAFSVLVEAEETTEINDG